MDDEYLMAFRSIWLDKKTYLLLKAWALWRKFPFKKPLGIKRALAVLITCGAEFYNDHRQDPDFRFPDVLAMKQRFDHRSPFEFTSKFRMLNYKLIWLDSDSFLMLKETSRALKLPMKLALPIIIDWGMAYYSAKMLGAGVTATKNELKLQRLIFRKNFPKAVKSTLEMFPPFLQK